jgi:hypothetical protein
MDEYNSGMDPEIKSYFRKILNSFSIGAFWLITIATLGIFFQLGIVKETIKWYNIVFYVILIISLIVLIKYYYKAWNKKAN